MESRITRRTLTISGVALALAGGAGAAAAAGGSSDGDGVAKARAAGITLAPGVEDEMRAAPEGSCFGDPTQPRCGTITAVGQSDAIVFDGGARGISTPARDPDHPTTIVVPPPAPPFGPGENAKSRTVRGSGAFADLLSRHGLVPAESFLRGVYVVNAVATDDVREVTITYKDGTRRHVDLQDNRMQDASLVAPSTLDWKGPRGAAHYILGSRAVNQAKVARLEGNTTTPIPQIGYRTGHS